MAIIRPNELPEKSNPVSTAVTIVDDGTSVGKTTLAQIADAAGSLVDGDFPNNGLMVRTGAGSYTNRSIVAGEGLSVSNGSGASANPSIALNGTSQAAIIAAATAVQPDDLATVATTGDYTDLANTPSLATVATSGDYDDLSNKPTLGSAAAANTGDFATAAQGGLADTAVQPDDLATVATSGEAGDVAFTPAGGIEASNVQDALEELDSEKANSSSLATVATSGDYDDLSNKPTLGTAAAADTGDFAAAARGLPSGGLAGRVLAKATGDDYDVEWVEQSGGGGGGGDVASRDALKALSPSAGDARYLKEAGREGWFIFDATDMSSEVTADTQEGIYVAPDSDDTGASGAWVRRFSGEVDVRWFGATGDARSGLDGSTTGSSTTFTSASGAFTSTDVGKVIHIGGAGAAGATLRTSIASITNATTIVLTDAASASASGAAWVVGVDDTAAIKAAAGFVSSMSTGGILRVPAGRYLATDALTSSSQQRVAIRGDGPHRTIFYHQRPTGGANNPLFFINGSAGSDIALTASASRQSYGLTVASTAGLAPGDYLVLEDESQRITDNSTGNGTTWIAEVVRVRSVDSGTDITLWGGLENDYTTDATVAKLNLRVGNSFEDFTIENPIQGSGGLASRGIYLGYHKDTLVRNVHLVGLDDQGIVSVSGIDLEIDAIHLKDLSKDNSEWGGTGYGINISYGNWGVLVRDVTAEKCRHLVTGGAGSGPENAHVLFSDCMARECYGSGFDTHPGGGRHWTFDNCHVYGPIENPIEYPPGFQIRSRFTVINDPVCANVGKAVQFVTSDDNILRGGTFTDVDVVSRVRAARNIQHIGTMRVTRPRAALFQVDNTSSALGSMPGLVIDADIYVEGDTSGPALDFDIWDDSYIISRDRIHAPDISDFSDGVPWWALYGGMAIDGVTKFENVPRIQALGNSLTLVSGQLFMAGLHIPKGERITRLSCQPAAAPTSQSNFWMALYDKDFNRLGVTSDAGSTGYNGTTPATRTLAAPVVTEYSGLYYVGILTVASTPSQLRGHSSVTALVSNPSLPRLVFNANTGLTNPASAPATATYQASTGSVPWVGVG